MKFPFEIKENICDWSMSIFGYDLFIWKPDPFTKGGYNLKDWGIGREYGDGILALVTPWFMLYLEK